jgi:lipopolysaccharide/colanic/teichoic acid biosynthesis glycosyltransferase
MMPTVLEDERTRAATKPEAIVAGPTVHVLAEDVFHGALVRERRRADRSNSALGLLLIGVNDLNGSEPETTWRVVFEVVNAAKRDTDLVGWFECPNAAGVIVADLPVADPSVIDAFESRIRLELARRLSATTMERLSLRLHVHGEVPDAAGSHVRPVDPLLARLGRPVPLRPVDAALKRALDVAGSLAFLALFAPVFAVVAALVKLTSRGPVFFRQVRIGEGGEPFTMLKFRSMRVNASADIHQQYVTQFIKSGAAAHSGTPGVFKLTNDSRITPIGNFIRKTSIDELPQFLNVLGGSMSLVGPRPPLKYEVEQYKAWHCRRVLEAKPGITGLWQVNGRSRTTFDEMVRLDLRYARSQSIWTDLKILLATPRAVIAGKGAC